MSQLTKTAPKSRDPPPALFNHPSRTASHASLPGPNPGAAPQPSAFTSPASAVTLPPSSVISPSTNPNPNSSSNNPIQIQPGGGLNISLPLPLSLPRRESTRATDRTDALWAEMQATLEAVELSAAGSTAGPRVFGPDHEHKLDGLRAAQIALAQAWARSEADEAIETVGGGGGLGGLGIGAGVGGTEGGAGSDGVGVAGRSDAPGGGGGTDGGAAAKSTAGTASAARPGSSGLGIGGNVGGQEKLGARMQEETEVDILLARKRREANDRYFQRVNQGVLDVVAKLEEVATSMRAVEQESKDLWGESESVPGSAKP